MNKFEQVSSDHHQMSPAREGIPEGEGIPERQGIPERGRVSQRGVGYIGGVPYLSHDSCDGSGVPNSDTLHLQLATGDTAGYLLDFTGIL